MKIVAYGLSLLAVWGVSSAGALSIAQTPAFKSAPAVELRVAEEFPVTAEDETDADCPPDGDGTKSCPSPEPVLEDDIPEEPLLDEYIPDEPELEEDVRLGEEPQ